MTAPRGACVGVVAMLMAHAATTSHASADDQIVWQWFGSCAAAKRVRVEVLQSGRSLYSGDFPACPMRRADIPDESPQNTLNFAFRSSAGIFGTEFRSMGTVEVEGNIWRAGGEPDAILLGVSFATADRILLNSLHYAFADRSSKSMLATDLTVKTSAVQDELKRPSSRK